MSRITKAINIANIEMDRYPLNPTMIPLLDHLRNGGEVPPIKVVVKPSGGYLIRDGRHRVTAYKLLGRETIEARFSTEIPRHLL